MADRALNEIVIVDCDDWVGVYVNGTLADEGHGTRDHANVLAFGAQHAPYTVRSIEADSAWLEEVVHFSGMPNALDDVIGTVRAVRPQIG